MIDKRILPLAMGGLGIGTTEFTIMGLLPDIADSLHVTIPEAGHFISAYAAGVVVGAPLLVGYSVKFPPKKVLMGLMVLFAIFNGLSAIASSYTFMMISRFLSGLPHGAFFGVGTVVASRLAGQGREARYIAFMFLGLTFANLAMVPLVTFIGHTFDWRWYFVIVTFIGLVAIASVYYLLPEMDANPSTGIRQELAFLKHPRPWYVLAITGIGFGGLFTWFSYITPLMTEVSHFKPENMAYIMVLAGSGMVAGGLFGGWLTDKMGATSTSIVLFLAMMLALLGVFFFSASQPMALVLTFICGAMSMATASPVNIMMMRAAPGGEMMAAAFMQAAFNFANSSGAFFGGIPLESGLPYTYPSLVGVAMTFGGLLVCIAYFMRYERGSRVSIAA